MFIKKSHSVKDGKRTHTTLQIAQSYRTEDGKSRHKTLLHLGPADKFIEKDIDGLINSLCKIKGIDPESLENEVDNVKAFGQIWALLALWKNLKLTQILAREKKKTKITFDVESHVKSLLFNRLDDPCSKLKLLTWLETVYIPGVNQDNIRYEYLLRAMDFLIEHKKFIEAQISGNILNMFDTELQLCFYDLTSTYFEAENSLSEDDIRQKGYSRDHRMDREQIVIGVVMTEDGIPIAHYTFPGNTADRSTLKEVVEDIRKRFGIKRVVIVADKGLVSGDNIMHLLETGQDFILGESASITKPAREVIREAHERRLQVGPEETKFIYDSIKKKTVKIKLKDGESKKSNNHTIELRYVASFNSKTALKQLKSRNSRISRALQSAEMIQQKRIPDIDKYSQIKGLFCRMKLTRFFKVIQESDKSVHIIRNHSELVYEESKDGWFLVITTDRESPSEEIISRYKDLKFVEHSFYELKHSLDLHPDFHWTEKRIQGHVMVCFIALQMASIFERHLSDLQITWERAMSKLRRISVIEYSNESRGRKALSVTHPVQLEIFKALGINKPTFKSL